MKMTRMTADKQPWLSKPITCIDANLDNLRIGNHKGLCMAHRLLVEIPYSYRADLQPSYDRMDGPSDQANCQCFLYGSPDNRNTRLIRRMEGRCPSN